MTKETLMTEILRPLLRLSDFARSVSPVVWEKPLEVIDGLFKKAPGKRGGQECQQKFQCNGGPRRQSQDLRFVEVVNRGAHDFVIDIKSIADRADIDQRLEFQEGAPPARAAISGMGNQPGGKRREGAGGDDKDGHAGKATVIKCLECSEDEEARSANDGPGPAALWPSPGLVQQHRKQRSR